MRATVAAAVEEENRKSLSPAWRERDLLNAVFQRVDKERHGKLTGYCVLSMFMRLGETGRLRIHAAARRGSRGGRRRR